MIFGGCVNVMPLYDDCLRQILRLELNSIYLYVLVSLIINNIKYLDQNHTPHLCIDFYMQFIAARIGCMIFFLPILMVSFDILAM